VVDVDAAVCSGCGADLAPAEPTSRLPAVDAGALALWFFMELPGLTVTVLGWLVVESTLMVVVGLVMLALPVLVQLFAADWGDVG
jgi:hypothetical protein